MDTIDINLKDGVLYVLGEITFFNVMSIYNKSLNYLNDMIKWDIDFSKLQSSNSVGLALVIEWIKLADKKKKPIRIFNLPENLCLIAKTAKLDNIICLN